MSARRALVRVLLPLAVMTAALWLAPARSAATDTPPASLQPLAPPPGFMQPEAVPDSALIERARVRFARARFDAVVSLLRPALAPDSLPAADRTAALELLGRSLVRTGDVEGGVEAFNRLLDAAPTWQMAVRQVRDDERAVFQRARLEWRSAHPEFVRAEAEALAHPVPRTAWYRQRRFQSSGGAFLALTAFAVVRHQRQVNHAHADLPDLPGHP